MSVPSHSPDVLWRRLHAAMRALKPLSAVLGLDSTAARSAATDTEVTGDAVNAHGLIARLGERNGEQLYRWLEDLPDKTSPSALLRTTAFIRDYRLPVQGGYEQAVARELLQQRDAVCQRIRRHLRGCHVGRPGDDAAECLSSRSNLQQQERELLLLPNLHKLLDVFSQGLRSDTGTGGLVTVGLNNPAITAALAPRFRWVGAVEPNPAHAGELRQRLRGYGGIQAAVSGEGCADAAALFEAV